MGGQRCSSRVLWPILKKKKNEVLDLVQAISDPYLVLDHTILADRNYLIQQHSTANLLQPLRVSLFSS